MEFAEELERALPEDLPMRAAVISKGALHLELVAEANRQFNLTRITGAREAAVKHVLDSVLPWRLFAGAVHVLDAGSGAGFPGVPLALVLPGVRFTLAESIQKRARFLEAALDRLELPNVDVAPDRAEDVLRRRKVDLIAARAVAPVSRALGFFLPAVKAGARALLYKGPDAEAEIADAAAEARRHGIGVTVVERYELPDGLGSRSMVQLAMIPGARRKPHEAGPKSRPR